MKKFVMLFIALFSAQAVNAQNYSPTGTWTWTGNVSVQKGTGPVSVCKMTVTANITATSATATPSFAGSSNPFCGAYVFQNTPYTVAYNAGPPETLTLINVLTTIYDCQGNIIAEFKDSTDDSLMINATLPQVISGGNCTIVGSLRKIMPIGSVIVN